MIIAAIVTVPDTVRSPLIYYLTKPSSFFFFFTSFIRFFFSHIKAKKYHVLLFEMKSHNRIWNLEFVFPLKLKKFTFS